MSVTKFHIMMIIYVLLLLSSSHVSMAGRSIPSSVPSTMRPSSGNYVKMKPISSSTNKFFHGKEVDNCLPKGFRHASAPSRYVNSQTLGGCSNSPSIRNP
ncbi:hypothetical protein LWI28_023150 [Acer negundo]|uniref:Transmembrane protein n=1 Tax=Acer negundo TaxID=4023 RepID=A0AAD5P3Y9_ACENE|nr:hypothetical protein LWI28_023150 [Acer negundo]KAK4857392.1 hypothetical protein QYF36_027494 [Acer negundo]